MITIKELENKIESLLNNNSDFIILDNLIKIIAKEENTTKKELKKLLYKNKSKFYNVVGFINGKRISLQNIIYSSKNIISKIIKKIENNENNELTHQEKQKVIDYIIYNLEEHNANLSI